ncbi:putative NAD/FAD-dependent oxidoreductase [Natronocella acetinitrilica]|uniref:NAD/FAD-dependent oxidoreductase n=1 Tax=Natronocella acetinitrilica TaxID=414046 RepID=A0AAE3G5B5_9GAMM|nr:FAD-dependent oxidoreductase [Natronocella acetinitrilica]MCP1675398.1 putative NAD/FAD-dependent oxidoreductase [Natronocella acetinitrilica]
MKIAVVGAGLAGLSCARGLVAAGHEVTLFEKSRGPGGRLSTRRGKGWQGDMGAQYFTARDARFADAVAGWRQVGVVAPWQARLVKLSPTRIETLVDDQTRWVGVPRMSALTRHLSDGLTLRSGIRIEAVNVTEQGLELQAESGSVFAGFERVAVAVPAPQAVPLLQAAHLLAESARSTPMHGCWAMLIRLRDAPELEFDGAFVQDSPLRWIARDSSKPGREGRDLWQCHAEAQWTAANIEREPDPVADDLQAAFRALTHLPEETAIEMLRTHRWRYSQSAEPLRQGYLYDPATGIGACGDWCHGDRVEGAWLSGARLADRILESGSA